MSALDQKRLRSIYANYKKHRECREQYFDCIMDQKDMGIWYACIRDVVGNNNEFEGGEYIVKVVATDKYPNAPPQFYFMTPNGVYEINRKVCISIGEFHSNSYSPGTHGGMVGFIRMLVNGIIFWQDLGNGISLINNEYCNSDNKKRKTMLPGILSNIKDIAKKSKEYNLANYPDLVDKFNDLSWNVLKKGLSEISPSLSKSFNFYI